MTINTDKDKKNGAEIGTILARAEAANGRPFSEEARRQVHIACATAWGHGFGAALDSTLDSFEDFKTQTTDPAILSAAELGAKTVREFIRVHEENPLDHEGSVDRSRNRRRS